MPITQNNDEIIPQEIIKNIANNHDIALKLDPKADIINAVKDFSKPIKTPLFESKISLDKMLNHLSQKSDFDKRIEYLNLVKPTLENPLFITKENERYRFVKTFMDSKDKILKFLSVIENENGEFIGITATPIKNTDLKNLLKGDIVWGGDTLANLNAPQTAKGLVADESIIPQSKSKADIEHEKAVARLDKLREQQLEAQAQAEREKERLREFYNVPKTPHGYTDAQDLIVELRQLADKSDKEIIAEKYKDLSPEKHAIISDRVHRGQDRQWAIYYETIGQKRSYIQDNYNITPIKEFGTNYAEFYRDGENAVKKLLAEKQGQVAGAFYKDGLGDIDLVWGKTNDELNGFGLEKIAKKHLGDFAGFNGDTPYEKLANGLNEIIKNGEVADKNGVKTILYNNKDKVYAVGLSKGWHGKGENEWVITAYEKKNFKNGSGDSKTISAYAEIKEAKTPASTADNIIPQNATKIKNERGIIAEVSHGNVFKDDIPFSHPVIGGGLFGGSLNGVSRDENGDVSLDFDNFVRGFFGGAVGAKLASAGLKKSAPNLYKKFMGYANKYPKMAQSDPKLLGAMLRSGRDSELKELERGLR